MSFEDELRGVIQQARGQRQQYEKEGNDFESQWLKMRETYVWGIFKESERAFRAEQISAEAKLTNGSIVLGVARNDPRENYRYSLKLSPEKETRTVICSSTNPESEDESFTLEHLTQHAVREKIKQFADYIARGNAPRSPATA
jgi:hypothetical protein